SGVLLIVSQQNAWAASSANNPYNLPNNLPPRYGDQTTQNLLKSINYAHIHDGENDSPSQISLPTNWSHLSTAEQFLVITNLERTSRGIPPVEGLSHTLDAYALAGAKINNDPSLPYGMSWGSNWAANSSVLSADYAWMYMDGPHSLNLGSPWGHAYNILNDTYIEMGAADVLKNYDGVYNSYTEAFIDGHVPHLYFTWQQELPYFGVQRLKTATVGSPYSFNLVGMNGRAPYSFSLLSRSVLGDGLTLSSSGEITGTPIKAGTGSFQVQITDKTGAVVATPTLSLSIANSNGMIDSSNPFGPNVTSTYSAYIQGFSGYSGTVYFRNNAGKISSSSFDSTGKALLHFNPHDGTAWKATKLSVDYPSLYSIQSGGRLTPVSWTNPNTNVQGGNLLITPVGTYSIQFSIPPSFLSTASGTAKNVFVVFVKKSVSDVSVLDAFPNPNELDTLAVPISLKSGQATLPVPVNGSNLNSGWKFGEVVSVHGNGNNVSIDAWTKPVIQAQVEGSTIVISVAPGYSQ
ncbi:MAG: putative Ig domain-containing protein, partial [Bacilli bacterium]